MITPKEKAEAYVRSQIPELMELSFGCRFEVTDKDNFPYSVGYIDTSGRMIMDGFHVGEFKPNEHHNVSKSWRIIGHPIQLQHWLRVLASTLIMRNADSITYTGNTIAYWFNTQRIDFNLTTGQPATLGDYQAFNEIVGI